ncbi:heme-dependent oxidative N-demethylase family protein [Roseinatronobacter sp. NSM]|uniref:heme-dependent oxidative N-demethylase family protein n=1 Tax=Roseinatronobacter sp. NSM TaxID=3457785 RepID=UPI0040355D10
MAILQSHLPYAPWMQPAARKLPGVMPLAPDEWLFVDDAYGAQMAERARLLATQEGDVLACLPCASDAARELLDLVLAHLPQYGFSAKGGGFQRPDGLRFVPDPARPLWSLGHLLQADFCILQKPRDGDEHVLTGAVLCFPSSWTLADKLGRALGRIHAPVDSYDAQMGARVQRMFDMIRPEQPLWRANLLRYENPALYQPRREFAPKDKRRDGVYIRSERQVLSRLPESRAVVFAIHTAVVHIDALTPEQRQIVDAQMTHVG